VPFYQRLNTELCKIGCGFTLAWFRCAELAQIRAHDHDNRDRQLLDLICLLNESAVRDVGGFWIELYVQSLNVAYPEESIPLFPLAFRLA